MDKPFKDFLEKEKELNIPDHEEAKRILGKISYYSLITGYKDIFSRYIGGKSIQIYVSFGRC